MTQKSSPRIAIIGGGPGGLMLARVLQTRSLAAIVFEQEKAPDERVQGGSLDLHTETGLRAVQLAGLDEALRAIARYKDQELRVLSREGEVLLESAEDEESGDRPEVDRSALRGILLDSLAPGSVRWGQPLRSIHQMDDGTYELLFPQGPLGPFDLVVGADGAWSHVRPLVSSAVPSYTGVTFIEAGLDEVDQRHPVISRLVGHGTMFAMADNKGLMAQRNGQGHIRVYAAMCIPERWELSTGFDASQPQVARRWLLEQFADWSPSLLALLQESNDQFAVRPLYMLPGGHRWEARAGVTLLGDAAHLMSPFAAEGVNLAMLDAAELACALSDRQQLAEAVHSYEQAMFERAEMFAKLADKSLQQAIAPDAAANMLAFFREITSGRSVRGT